MTTPEEAVREAREALVEEYRAGIERVLREVGRALGVPLADEVMTGLLTGTENWPLLDALLTAERARLAARVSELPSSCGSNAGGLPCCVLVDAVLALLREGA